MYLVIFPEGTRYNPELKNVIAESQAFAAKEGTSEAAAHLLHFNSAYSVWTTWDSFLCYLLENRHFPGFIVIFKYALREG